MPEATIDDDGNFVCGRFNWTPMVENCKTEELTINMKPYYLSFTDSLDLDDLYAVLHARHMAQAYDKTYLDKIQKIADRMLYKGEPNEVLD